MCAVITKLDGGHGKEGGWCMNRPVKAFYPRAIITHWYDKTKHGFAYDGKLRLYFSGNTIEVSGLIEKLGRHEVGQCVEYSILYPSDGTKGSSMRF